MTPEGEVKRIKASEEADLWINGGVFIFRPQIFDHMRDREELVEAPFRRLIVADQWLAVRHEGFWRPMDTLKDRQVLEELIEKGLMPWFDTEAEREKLATNRKNAW
jgi:glucose-1-phosphate cytidylyltransferase